MKDVDAERITLFCSIGAHFEAAVHELKQQFPRAKLTAVAPASIAEPLAEGGLLDNVIEMTKNKLRILRDFPECVRLLRAIRAEKSDLIVTMYDSRALNLLQSLSGARNHAVFDTRHVLCPTRVARFYLFALVFGGVGRLLLGGIMYGLIQATLTAWSAFQKRRFP
jgi:hypothetical protein